MPHETDAVLRPGYFGIAYMTPNITTDTPRHALGRPPSRGSSRTDHLRLFGSLDRFNYGDLLFPLVTRFALGRLRPGLETSVYGLVRSGLERYGAVPSRGVADLYADVGAAMQS